MKYTRIDIKSEADLPKEIGHYIAHYKEFDINSPAGTVLSGYNYMQKQNWMKSIDWYLIEDTELSYPEGFVEWLAFDGRPFDPVEEIEDGKACYWDMDNNKNIHTEEVYEYWLNEIKNK